MISIKKETKRVFLILLLLAFSVSLFAAIGITREKGKAYADQAFEAGKNFEYMADEAASYVGLSFEYKITSAAGTCFEVCVLEPSWMNYYGYFKFDANGAVNAYEGVTVRDSEDGFKLVTIDFDAVTVIYGTKPATTSIFFARGDLITANGFFKNITFLKKGASESSEAEETQTFTGKKYLADWNSTIYAPRALLYEKVTFEYKVYKVGKESDSFGICLLDDNNANYFGYYYFGSNGLNAGVDNSGVTCTKLDDGYYRVVLYVPELCRTNQVDNRNKAPKRINSIFLRDEWTKDDVYIRNVNFIRQGSFAMEEGASIRLERPYGIKFRANIPQSKYDADALYGMAIIPASYLTTYSLSGDYINALRSKGISFKNAYLKPQSDENLDYYIESYLGDLHEEDVDTEYVGIAYKLSGGVYTYAEKITECRRSISEVAGKAVYDVENFRDFKVRGQDLIRGLVGIDRETTAFTVNGFDSLENFKKNADIPTSNTLTLSASKGESELGELVLTGSSLVDGMTYIVTPYDLIHEDGSTVLSKDGMTLYNGHYINVDTNYRHKVYPKGDAVALDTGYYMDALVPYYAAVACDEAVFDRTGGDNNTVVIDIKVPKGQKAGLYTGKIRVEVVGVGYKDINVSFTVYDFTLPEETAAKTDFAIPVNYLTDVFGEYGGYESELYRELYDYLIDFNLNAGRVPSVPSYGDYNWTRYMNMLADYAADPRISTINLYAGFSMTTYTYTYNYRKKTLFGYTTEQKTDTYTDLIVLDEYDRQESYVNNQHETVVYTDYGLRTTLKKIAEYCIANDVDIFKKLIVNSPQNDEPSDAKNYAAAILSYNAVRRSIDYVLNGADIDWTGHENIKASLDDIPFLVTTDPSDEVVAGNNIIDNVISQTAYIPADEYNERVDLTIEYKYLKDFIALVAAFDTTDKPTSAARLYEYLANKPEHVHVWWYNCCLSINPYTCYGVNSNTVQMRANRWAQFGMGVEGELYCSVNNWFSLSDDDTVTVLTEDEIWQGKFNQAGLIGDGVLVYPNVERYEDYDFRFCPTYRLFIMRESVDDYNYLAYAQKLIDRLGDAELKQQKQAALDGIVHALYTKTRNITTSAGEVRSARAQVAELIRSLA